MRAGVISKIVNILFPFLVRAVFIRTLGAEYLGVNSLFTSVLSVLSLTELGFGSAVVFSMYRAIAEDNHQMINELLLFYSVGGKMNLPPHGKENFARHGKQFFTCHGKEFFTS